MYYSYLFLNIHNIYQTQKIESETMKDYRMRNRKVQMLRQSKQILRELDQLDNNHQKQKITEYNNQINIQEIKQKLEEYSAEYNTIPDEITIENDKILKTLIELEAKAKKSGVKCLQEKANLLLGKRLITLEIQLKKRNHEQKMTRKQEIEQQFFRQNRIQNFNYQQLIKQKLLNNTLIIRPYGTGKGFIESDIYEQEYENLYSEKLQECGYIEVTKNINKIIMQNISFGSAHSSKGFDTPLTAKFLILMLVLLIVLIFVQLSTQQKILQILIISVSVFLSIGMIILAVLSFINKPNNNDQSQQSYQDVTKYLEKLNNTNKKNGKKFRWDASEDFMYLQVKFDEEISPFY